MTSPARAPVSSGISSSTMPITGGNLPTSSINSPLNLSHHEVILGFNSEVNTTTVEVSNAIAISGAMICSGKTKEVEIMGGLNPPSSSEVLNKTYGRTRGIQTHPNQYFQHTSLGHSRSLILIVGPLPSVTNP